MDGLGRLWFCMLPRLAARLNHSSSNSREGGLKMRPASEYPSYASPGLVSAWTSIGCCSEVIGRVM